MQVVQEALNNSDLLSNLVLALPIMTHGRNKLKGSGMASVVFALPPPAGPAHVDARKRQFVAGATLVTFVGGFSEAQEDVIAWLLDMLEKAQLTPEELAVFDWGKDGTAPRRRLHVLGHSSAMLLLLSLLPATIERPEKLREGGKTLSELLEGLAKEAEEAEYLVDGEGCDDTLCTPAGPVAGPADEGAGAGSGSQGAQEQQPEGGARAELVPGPAPPAKQCKPAAQAKKAEKARRRGTAEEEAEAADNEDNGAEVADRQELLDETGRGRAGGTAEPGGGVSHHSLSQTATCAAQPAARPSHREVQVAAACTSASSSGEPLPHQPATAPPVPVGGQDNVDAAGSSGGRSRPPAAPAARQPRDTRGDVAAGVEAASGAATTAAASLAGCKAANAVGAQQPASALPVCGPSSLSCLRRCSAEHSTGVCEVRSQHCEAQAGQQVESPLAALPLLSPVALCGGSPAGGGAQQPAGVVRNAAAVDAAPAEAAGAAAVALAVGAAAAATVEEQEVQQHAATGSRGPTGGAAAQQHRLPEPQPQTPPPNAAGTPAPHRIGMSLLEEEAEHRAHQARYYVTGEAVVSIVFDTVDAVEADARQQGEEPDPGLYPKATAVLLLSLVLLQGLEDTSAQRWLAKARSMEELVEQLETWAGSKQLQLDTCLSYVWAGAPDWNSVKAALGGANEGLASRRLDEGSYNAIFKVVGADKLILRKPLGGAYRDLLTATYKQGPALLRHLRAACRLHRGNMRSIGVRIMGLLPVVNGHVPDLTTRKALDDLRTTRNVVIAMVMEELTPTDKAAKGLALLAQARQAGVWPRSVALAMASGVLCGASGLFEMKLYHEDIKANNMGWTDLTQLGEVTWIDNDDLSQDSAGVVQMHHTTQYTALKKRRCLAAGNAYFRPIAKLLNTMDTTQVQGFKAALVAVLLPEVMLLCASNDCQTFTPRLWTTGAPCDGGLGVLYPNQLMSAALAQVLATLLHPMAKKRKALLELVARVRSFSDEMNVRAIRLAGPDAATLPCVPAGAEALAHLCSPPQTHVLDQLLHTAVLERWSQEPFEDRTLQPVLNLLYEAAYCTWPAGPINGFMQRLLRLAVLCDTVSVAKRQRPDLLLLRCKGDRGRTLLHLLGATGNTEGYLAVLRALDAAGLRAECRQFMSEADRNGDTAVMLAAVHGRLAPIMAHVQFAEERLLEEDISMYSRSLRHELAVKGWLNGLVKKSALGSLLTILCSLYSGHNDKLSRLLAYVPPVLWLPEAVAQQGGEPSASSSGSSGQAAAGGSLAAAHAFLEAAQGLATDAFEAHNSARVSHLTSLLVHAHETPDPAAGRVAGLEVKQVLRSALELFTTAATQMPPPQSKAMATGGINSMARRMLMIKTAPALGADTLFHGAAAMAGPLEELYGWVTDLYDKEFADTCLAVTNEDGRTPIEVLLHCHPVLMSKPGFDSIEFVDHGRAAPEGAELSTIAASLRAFVAARGEDTATAAYCDGPLRMELDKKIKELLEQ